ncbi:MAG: GTP-binding protein, partial [Chloroflexi bacterium]|nr:GTP-binding protein [Chloroflexota bacterium]
MKEYETDQIRNVAMLGHGGTGKTSIGEAALFISGAINRLGRVDDGNTTSDYDPDEVKRQMSISLSLLPCEWDGHKINLIDTPGYLDFLGEVRQGIRAADAALIAVDSVSGVQVGTDLAWGYADEAELPRFVFVNRMDRENADFPTVVAQLQESFGKKCVPLQTPIGAQDTFAGVVDLLELRAYVGEKAEAGDVPEASEPDVERYREQLIEAVAETDDALINKFLEGETLTEEELRAGLRAGVCSGTIIPILCGSATKNIGVPRLLAALVEYGPSPADRPETEAKDDDGAES